MSNLAASEIVDVLAHLPAPYSHFATRAENDFALPDDEAHRTVLTTLEDASIAENSKIRMKDQRQVKLL